MSSKPSSLNLDKIDTERFGDFYVSAMRETYVISFGSDEVFHRWGGSTGEIYLKKLSERSRLDASFCRTLLVDNVPAGVVEAYRHSEADLYLAFLFVASAARGKKIGSTALEELQKWARSRNYLSAHLTVEEANCAAIKFYEALGWQSCGRSGKSPSSLVYRLNLG